MGNKIVLRYSIIDKNEKERYYNSIHYFLMSLYNDYPGFENWYKSIFESNYDIKENREIIICQQDCNIAGISILKKSIEENKICTLRVNEKYRKRGIGRTLMEKSFEWLNDERPLITLPAKRKKEFQTLFKYYNFTLEQKKMNYYKILSTELVYNGELPSEKSLISKLLNYKYSHSDLFMENSCFDFFKFNPNFRYEY